MCVCLTNKDNIKYSFPAGNARASYDLSIGPTKNTMNLLNRFNLILANLRFISLKNEFIK